MMALLGFCTRSTVLQTRNARLRAGRTPLTTTLDNMLLYTCMGAIDDLENSIWWGKNVWGKNGSARVITMRSYKRAL